MARNEISQEQPEPSENIVERRPHAYIIYGAAGHEGEYIFKIQLNKYSAAQEIPFQWEGELGKLLGEDWTILNRGHRIEIMPPKLKRSAETDSKVRDAIKTTVGNDYELVEKG